MKANSSSQNTATSPPLSEDKSQSKVSEILGPLVMERKRAATSSPLSEDKSQGKISEVLGPQVMDRPQRKRGFHEIEYCEEESNLHDKMKSCKKNPGHQMFLPVSGFKVQDLPEGIQDHLVFDFLKTVIFLTVRLIIKFRSSDRCSRSAKPKLGTGMKGKGFGSGMVMSVSKWVSEEEGETCPCPRCRLCPETASRKWGKVVVWTACHIVFNREESRHTTCDLGFDCEGDDETCPKLEGVGVWDRDHEKDYMKMYCVTHDESVYREIEKVVQHHEDLLEKLRNKYGRTGQAGNTFQNPVLCVSHPHGESKRITIGNWKGKYTVPPYQWKYTTATCPGSSGAPVFRLGGSWWILPYQSIHSGCFEDGENESGWSGLYCV